MIYFDYNRRVHFYKGDYWKYIYEHYISVSEICLIIIIDKFKIEFFFFIVNCEIIISCMYSSLDLVSHRLYESKGDTFNLKVFTSVLDEVILLGEVFGDRSLLL